MSVSPYVPIRCYTCGKVIQHIYTDMITQAEKNNIPYKEYINSINLGKRWCCRVRLLAPIKGLRSRISTKIRTPSEIEEEERYSRLTDFLGDRNYEETLDEEYIEDEEDDFNVLDELKNAANKHVNIEAEKIGEISDESESEEEIPVKRLLKKVKRKKIISSKSNIVKKELKGIKIKTKK